MNRRKFMIGAAAVPLAMAAPRIPAAEAADIYWEPIVVEVGPGISDVTMFYNEMQRRIAAAFYVDELHLSDRRQP